MNPRKLTPIPAGGKYDDKAVRWLDKGDHYELIIMGDQIGRVLLTNIIMDMIAGDKSKEIHVFVGTWLHDDSYDKILQQLLTYEYRVGICIGNMCIDWLALLLTCQECYLPTGNIYRITDDVFRWLEGWYQEFDFLKFLVAKLREEGVKPEYGNTYFDFTMQQLIEWGFAKDYNDYLKREIRHK